MLTSIVIDIGLRVKFLLRVFYFFLLAECVVLLIVQTLVEIKIGLITYQIHY